jgi:hypothetical protein
VAGWSTLVVMMCFPRSRRAKAIPLRARLIASEPEPVKMILRGRA